MIRVTHPKTDRRVPNAELHGSEGLARSRFIAPCLAQPHGWMLADDRSRPSAAQPSRETKRKKVGMDRFASSGRGERVEPCRPGLCLESEG
jgi:hypothetical protein